MQEYCEARLFVRTKTKGAWAKTLKNIRYYVFVAIIGELRLKVIVKQIEEGQKNFHSIYPSWQIHKDQQGNPIKKFYYGNPEVD